MQLSVLDQSVAVEGRPQDLAIRQTVALAEHCEALGYHRFWVSEHHSLPTIVGTAPEILMAAIAMRTQRIRIGSAGVMLPHYAPLKVAEQFRVLDALAPGRIDLGVGRAPGSDGRTARLLNPNSAGGEDFPQQVLELQAWVSGHGLPPGHPGQGIFAYPTAETAPTLWMLGSSNYGAHLAAQLALPYAYAHFIGDGVGAEQALQLYRSGFRRDDPARRPHSAVCVWALAAETEAEAWRLFQSRERARMDRQLGRFGPLLSPENALRDYSASEQLQREQLRQDAFVGSAPQVADKLRRLMAQLQADELVIITWTHDPQAQRQSYALLAREFDLPGAGA